MSVTGHSLLSKYLIWQKQTHPMLAQVALALLNKCRSVSHSGQWDLTSRAGAATAEEPERLPVLRKQQQQQEIISLSTFHFHC